jgi:hypothetical protein
MNHQVQKGRKAVTEVLRFIGDEIVEAEELFEQWARHRRYRYEGEHKLAEERFLEEQALRKRLKYLKGTVPEYRLCPIVSKMPLRLDLKHSK